MDLHQIELAENEVDQILQKGAKKNVVIFGLFILSVIIGYIGVLYFIDSISDGILKFFGISQ